MSRTLQDAGLTVASLIGTYFQVSRSYRQVACLPPGETGVQACARAGSVVRPGDTEEWAAALGERSAGDFYLRVFGEREGHALTLTREEFDKFRELGGATYAASGDDKLTAIDWPARARAAEDQVQRLTLALAAVFRDSPARTS